MVTPSRARFQPRSLDLRLPQVLRKPTTTPSVSLEASGLLEETEVSKDKILEAARWVSVAGERKPSKVESTETEVAKAS